MDNIGIFRMAQVYDTFVEGSKPGDFLITSSTVNGSIAVGPSNCTTPVIVTPYGGVGIGKAEPTKTLDVAGSIGATSVTISGDIIPTQDKFQNIGSSNVRFNEAWIETIHIGPNTLYIGDTPIIGTTDDTIMIKADKDQSITVKTPSIPGMA